MTGILVTGAAGFVGRALVERLAGDGHRVVAAVRRDPCAWPERVSAFEHPDLSGPVDWASALQGVDAVVHVAARAHVLREKRGEDALDAFRAVNRDATLVLARASAVAGVRRFVFVSSLGVLGGGTHGRAFSIEDTPAPHSPYALAKWEAEQGLAQIAAETDLEITIVRPPLVLGPGAKGNLGLIARLIARGIPLPFGAITHNRRDVVSRDVLVDLLTLCIAHPRAAGGTFLASDGVTRSTADIVRTVAAADGRTARLLPVPPALLGAALSLLGRNAMREHLLGDLEVDISATCLTLDWHPTRA